MSRVRNRACGLAAAAALAVSLALAAPAPAADTIGSDLADNVDYGGGPIPPFTAVTETIPGRPTAAPFDGVITRWRFKASGADWGTLRLRVMRKTPGATTFAALRSTPPESPGNTNGISVFPASLPIAAGDLIGIEATAFVQGDSSVPGVSNHVLSPSPADGGAAAAPLDTDSNEPFYNADIERDADRDGLGDESQDPMVAPDGCGPVVPPPPPPPPPDSDLLELRAAKRKPLARLAVRASCFSDCELTLKGAVKSAGDRFKLRKRTAELSADEIRRLGARVKGAAKRRRLAGLIADGKRAKAKIVGVARVGDQTERERVKIRVVAPKNR